MLLQLPRLTNSLRDPFDVDHAFLYRKSILQNLISPARSANSLQESELARKIVYKWDEASNELRQVYKEFVRAVVELMGNEVVSEEFEEVALSVYRVFCGQLEEDEDEDEDEGDKRIAQKK